MDKIKAFFANKWVGFALATLLYILWFVVWTGNLWFLLGVPIIYDLYISKYLYRYIGRKNEELCERSDLYRNIYEWVNAIVFATVVASLIHIFFFQMYVIPSSSMEKTLLIGDYLYVSKLSYGPQVPNTPVAMPFVYNTMPFSTAKSYSECIQWDYHRLRGRGKVEREDVVVFNFPAGDTVLVENQAITYYDVLREYQAALGEKEGRERLHRDYTVVARPVDKRENYIKRCVGVPGDTLQIVNTELFVNGEAQPACEERQHIYIVRTTAPLSDYAFRNLGITEYNGTAPYYYAATTEKGAEQLRKYKSVESVERYNNTQPSLEAFPHDERFAWTQDNMGPLWVPQKGATIELSTANLPLYERIIDQYEGHDLRVEGDKIFIDGVESNSYTFAMDYYFMMGDNRHNSADSRYWGFVPEDHIVGKALFIAFSKGDDGIRWGRLFNKVK